LIGENGWESSGSVPNGDVGVQPIHSFVCVFIVTGSFDFIEGKETVCHSTTCLESWRRVHLKTTTTTTRTTTTTTTTTTTRHTTNEQNNNPTRPQW
jgi:hypothetical protein